MYQEEKEWFNQNLLLHKDIVNNTNSTLNIGLAASISPDRKTFDMVTLSIGLTSSANVRKVCNLNLQNALEIANNLKVMIKSGSGSLTKQFFQDKQLQITISEGNIYSNTYISILSSPSDGISIILPYNVTLALYSILEKFVSDYMNIVLSFTSRFISSDLLKQINKLKDDTNVGQSMLLETLNNKELSMEDVNNNNDIKDLNDEFETFFNQQKSSIDLGIDELLEKEETKSKYKPNMFITQIFDNIDSMEKFFTSENKNKFNIELQKIVGVKNLLPGATENDIATYRYFSNWYFEFIYYLNKKFNKSIPTSINISKYRCSTWNSYNVEIASELTLLGFYIKELRSRLEAKDNNPNTNKAMFHIAYRIFTDMYSFSFIENDEEKLKTFKGMMKSKFETLKENNFFDASDKILQKYSIKTIEWKDLDNIFNTIGLRALIGKNTIQEVNDLQASKYPSIIYSSKMPEIHLVEEQLIPIQKQLINKGIIKELPSNEVIEQIASTLHLDIDDSIRELIFPGTLKFSNATDDILLGGEGTLGSNVFKYIKKHKDLIPEEFRVEFLSKIKRITPKKKFIFNFEEFPLEDIGEPILRALYIWNEFDRNSPYSEYIKDIENCMMTKDLILTKYKLGSLIDENSSTLDDKDGEFDLMSIFDK